VKLWYQPQPGACRVFRSGEADCVWDRG